MFKGERMNERFFHIMFLVSLVLLAFGNIASIGYGLYLWGGVGIAFSAALWGAFKVWLCFMIVSFVLVATSVIKS